ncbi:hypothetical protein TNCV_629491 [Trichonephila clavipes]|nr:hypothetical protein TNCV_629491 [Trichonephila clavipes]
MAIVSNRVNPKGEIIPIGFNKMEISSESPSKKYTRQNQPRNQVWNHQCPFPLRQAIKSVNGEGKKVSRDLMKRNVTVQIRSWDKTRGCGSPEVKVPDHGRHAMSSSPVPLKTRRVGKRCTLNLSRAETSYPLVWCDS